MKSQAPTAETKAWREDVRELGSIVRGDTPAVIHHPVGRTAKHNKLAIGHWWVLPLTDGEHNLLHKDHDAFVRMAFGVRLVGRWDAEKLLFRRVIQRLGYEPPHEVVEAIMGYQR